MNMYAEVNNDSPCPWNLVMIVQLFFVYGVGNHSSRNLLMNVTNMLVVGFEVALNSSPLPTISINLQHNKNIK